MSDADKRQVGGSHYKAVDASQEHWNLVTAYGWDYFTAQVIKYMMRWRKKNGVEDLRKARHFLDKLIEVETKPKTIADCMKQQTDRAAASGILGPRELLGTEPSKGYVDQ